MKKKCIRCGEEKTLEEFSIHKKMKAGRLNKCKPCCVECTREHRAKKPKAELQEMRRVEYEKQLEKGNRTRERSLSEIREQHDPLTKKTIALRHFHTNRARGPAPTELDDFVFREAVRLSQARNEATGIRWEIDHVIPINGPQVSGLHNAFNMQVVPRSWNSSKSNRRIEHYFQRAEIGY